MPVATTKRGPIAYDIVGNGPAMVMSSGLGGIRQAWAHVIPLLAAKHTVVTYDHVGTGESGRRTTSHDVTSMAQDVSELLRVLGLGEIDFVGHALGAAIGLDLASRSLWPIRRLVLASGFSASDTYMRRCLELRKGILAHQGIEAFCAATPLFLFPGWWINANADQLDAKARQAIAAFPGHEITLARIAGLLEFDATDRLHRIQQPALIIAAANDGFTAPSTSQKLAAELPLGAFMTMRDGAHMVAELLPEDFAQLVSDFLT